MALIIHQWKKSDQETLNFWNMETERMFNKKGIESQLKEKQELSNELIKVK